nr:hypothetical protein [Microbacterium liquefaciens]
MRLDPIALRAERGRCRLDHRQLSHRRLQDDAAPLGAQVVGGHADPRAGGLRGDVRHRERFGAHQGAVVGVEGAEVVTDDGHRARVLAVHVRDRARLARSRLGADEHHGRVQLGGAAGG